MKGSKQPQFELTKPQAEQAARTLCQLLERELEVDVGQLQAATVLEQLLQELGPLLYNKAIQDVQEFLGQRFEILQADLWALEK